MIRFDQDPDTLQIGLIADDDGAALLGPDMLEYADDQPDGNVYLTIPADPEYVDQILDLLRHVDRDAAAQLENLL